MGNGRRWHREEKVASHQLAAFIFPGIGATAALFLPRSVTELVGRDAWAIPLATTVYAIAVVAVVLALHRRFPGKTPVGVAETLFGPAGRVAVGLLYGWFALHLTATAARQVGEFFILTMLPRTPPTATVALMILVLALAFRAGLEVVLRLVVPLVAVIVAAVVLTIGLTTEVMDFRLLQPMFASAPLSLARGVGVSTAFFGEVVLLAWYLPHVNDEQSAGRWLYGGTAALGVLTAGLYMAVMVVFGERLITETTVPVFRLIRDAHLGEFFDRLDPLFLSVWQLAFFLKLSFLFYPALSSVAEAFQLNDFRFLAFPLGVMAVALSSFLFEGIRDVAAFMNRSAVPYGVTLQFVLPSLLLGASFLARPKEREERNPTRGVDESSR